MTTTGAPVATAAATATATVGGYRKVCGNKGGGKGGGKGGNVHLDVIPGVGHHAYATGADFLARLISKHHVDASA
jgi:hypothetical protein